MLRKKTAQREVSFSRKMSYAMLSVALLLPFLSPAQDVHLPRTTEDLPPGASQQKAVTACTECHEARIIVQQRLSKTAWTKEVDKMIKWGAVVDAADRDALIDYLSSSFGPDKPPYEPPKTTRQNSR